VSAAPLAGPVSFVFDVAGRPKPKGSTKSFAFRRVNGKLGTRTTNDNPGTKGWQALVEHAASRVRPAAPLSGPVHVEVEFRFERPKSHRTKKGDLKAHAPLYPTSKRTTGDLDKLLRSTFDALGDAGLFGDDAQVVSTRATKDYTDPLEAEGARIKVTEVTAPQRFNVR